MNPVYTDMALDSGHDDAAPDPAPERKLEPQPDRSSYAYRLGWVESAAKRAADRVEIIAKATDTFTRSRLIEALDELRTSLKQAEQFGQENR